MNKLLIPLLLLFFIASCGPRVMFVEPQPQGKKDLTEFKAKYVGTYLLERDSSMILRLSERHLIAIQQVNVAEPVNFFDSTEGWWLDEGRLFGSLIGEDGVPVTTRNDSVFGLLIIQDTVFSIGEQQVLRYHKGRYYLNKEVGPQQWEVQALWTENNNLILADIYSGEDITIMQQLEMVEEIRDDSSEVTSYRSSPTRRQLSQFVNSGGFSHRDTFKRIK